MELVQGCIKNILEKFAEPIIKKTVDFAKDEWEKFKVDSDIAFTEYLRKSYNKYSKVKTILHWDEPKELYNFFETPYLSRRSGEIIDSSDVNNLLDISRFIIIQGIGGIGKSTFMKHLFINELSKNDLIPVFIELKDLNDLDNDYNICDYIFSKLNNLESRFEKDYMGYALQSGCFLFLLDGYDEIVSDKKDVFFKKITTFCDKYSENYYIISSRPYNEFIEFQRFTVLKLCDFNKKQALSLISKVEFDEKIKCRFIKALEENLYDRHRSFASNPLLLNIMLLTYDNYAEIPEKLHLFYSNAFETLYSKHDATKGAYKRELKSKLSIDSFKKVFSNFCFVTYFQGKIEFTYDELIYLFSGLKFNNVKFDAEAMIEDLVNCVCVLYKEGLNYRFTHRSFQEYFTAIFLKELSDYNLNKVSVELIKKDTYRSANDSVFYMLYDMDEQKFEQNILIPLLEKIESKYESGDKYDFYFREMNIIFEFDFFGDDQNLKLGLISNTGGEYIEFIKKYAYKYMTNKNINEGDDILLRYFESNNYVVGTNIEGMILADKYELYEIFKKTWIGNLVTTIADLKEILEKKKQKYELGLDELLIMN